MTPGRIRTVRIAMIFALALSTPWLAPRAAGAADTSYFAGIGSQESMLSEMALHPSAVRVGTTTYLAFQGPGFDPYVASYDDSTGMWAGPYRAGTNPLRLDAHGAPALLVDSGGYLHVFYGCHSSQMFHAISTLPGDASHWMQAGSPTMSGTYPQPFQLPNGQVMLFYRQNGYDYSASWVFRTSDDGGRTWRPGSANVLASELTNSWYAHFSLGESGIVHCAFTRLQPGIGDTYLSRHNVYYVYRDLSGIWRNAKGEPVTIPVTSQAADEKCLVYDSGDEAVNELVVNEEPTGTVGVTAMVSPIETPAVDSSATPLLQFITGTGRGLGAYTWKFARHNGTSWDISDMLDTDHNFDAATFDAHPGGSIDSYVVTGGSDGHLTRPSPMEGRGGRIQRWHSPDRGATWTFGEVISPEETSTLFSDPQVVRGASPTSTVMFTEWSSDKTAFFHRIYLWGAGGLVRRTSACQVDRLAGPDRIETAIAISGQAFPDGANTVVLATSRDFPDALAAGPLAQAMGGPILLVPPTGLPSTVASEVQRLGATHAVILGSPAAVPDAVASQLVSRAGVRTVERIAGSDRYRTAQMIAVRLKEILGPLGKAVVVNGKSSPDGLAAGPLAAACGYPIDLASGDRVPQEVSALLADLEVTSTVIVGGPSVVTQTYEASLPAATRVAGGDRFSTAAAVARYSFSEGLLPDRILVASGYSFADGLTGSTLAARARAPLVLTAPSALPTATAQLLSDVASRTVQAYVLGGPSSVGTSATAQVIDILHAHRPATR